MRRATMGALLLLLLLSASASVEAAASKWVVPPDVTGRLQSELTNAIKGSPLALQSIVAENATVTITMKPKSQGDDPLVFAIEREENGVAIRPKTGSNALMTGLRKKLDVQDLTYLFVELRDPPQDALPAAIRKDGAWEAAIDQNKARLAGRLGHGAWLKESLPPAISKLLDELRTGHRDDTRKAAEELLTGPNPPPGTYSLYLASGGEPPKNLREAIRNHPLEPRLYLLRAQQYIEAGHRQLAAESLYVAMRLPLADEAVRQEAAKLGLTVAESWPEAIPSHASTPHVDLSGWWFILFGLLALCLLVLSVKERRHVTAATLALGIATVFLVMGPLEKPNVTTLPDALMTPLAGGPCGLAPGRIGIEGFTVDALCPDRQTTLVVSVAQEGTWAFASTAHHHINLQDRDAQSASPQLRQAVSLLKEALEVAERDGFRAPPSQNLGDTARSLSTTWSRLPTSERAELRVGAGVVLSALLILLFLFLKNLRTMIPPLRREQRWVWLLLGSCLLLYLVVPSRMLMVYSGYDRVDALAQGELPRYGVSSLFSYGPLLWLGGVDHCWIQWVNRLLGLGCLAVAWDLGRMVFRMDKRTSWLYALLLVTMPLLVRGFTSEAISPFPTLCLLVGLRILSQPAPRDLGAACILFVCAAMGRPEIAAAVVFVPLWFFVTYPKRTREEAPWLVFGALILVVALQVARTLMVTEDMAGREALPLASNPLGAAFHVLTLKSAHASIDYTPLGFTPLLLLGAWMSGRRRAAFAFLIVAAVWLGATGVDLVRVSIPRLHLGPILLMTPLVALGALGLYDKAKIRGVKPARAAAIGLCVVWTLGISLNVYALFGPVTEEGEESLWRDTVEALPQGPGCLLRYGFGDPVPSPKTPLYSPDYLLPEGWKTSALSTVDSIKSTCEGPTYVLLGTHCFTHLRPPDTPAPEGLAERELCSKIRARSDLRPIFEREVRNIGEPPGLLLFPQAEALPVGLYELKP